MIMTTSITNRVTLLAMLIMLVTSYTLSSQELSVVERADSLYTKGDYSAALEQYLLFEENGMASWALYYNIGNCYFKEGEYGKSILYYERALKLNPSGEDIIYNLNHVKQYTVDQIGTLPEFVLVTWVKKINYALSSNTWAYFSLFMMAVALFLLLFFRYGATSFLRKSSFFLSMTAFLLFVIMSLFSFSKKRAFYKSDSAILLSPVVTVRNSPDNSGSALFVLHEGTKLKILEELGDWSRVELTDGRQGWISSENIEEI
jgi:tetratricopeptide (TPR) repeat protein